MLDTVWALLETWEKEGIEEALLSQTDLPTQEALAGELAALPANDRRVILTRLHDFAEALEAYQQELSRNMAATDAEIRKLATTRNACLSYSTRNKD